MRETGAGARNRFGQTRLEARCPASPCDRAVGAFSGWKPVAITVIFTASAIDSFMMTPKLICTSSQLAASRMIEQASLTSCRPRRLDPVMLIRMPREPEMRESSSSGRADGLARRFHRRLLAAADRRAHHGVAHADHGGLDIREVAIDQARRDDDVADALHRLPQQIVGHLEGFEEAGAARHQRQQPVVGNRDHGIDGRREAAQARPRPAACAARLRSRRAW